MEGTNLGDIQYGLAHGKGVFAGANEDAYFLQPDGSVLDLRGQLIRQASAEGKAIYDAHDQRDVTAFKVAALVATTVEATTVKATTVDATTVEATTVDATTVKAAVAEATALTVNKDLVMFEGEQKYYITLSSGTLTATAAYLIDLTADEHVTVEIVDGDSAEYEDGSEVLNGAELTITLTFAEGYEVDTFTVNTVAKTSPATHTVNGAAVVIVVASKTTT